MHRLIASLVTLLATALIPLAASAAYPDKPVRLIVPYPPGGTTDAVARVLAEEMGKALGASIVIENKAGAGGIIGTETAARSAPDGYTLVFGNVGPLAINASLYKDLPYDPQRDFVPVSLVADFPLFLVVHPSVPARTVQEVIAYAKRQPNGLSYASVGVGSMSHVTGELFASMAGIKLVHVPYKGGGPAITDLIAGHVPMMFLAVMDDNIKTGRLRLIATSAAKRSSAAPQAPTIAEAALPGFNVTAWFGILAPTGTPRPIVDKVNRAIVAAMDNPTLAARVRALGGEPTTSSPEAFAKLIKDETVRWRPVVKDSGASVR